MGHTSEHAVYMVVGGDVVGGRVGVGVGGGVGGWVDGGVGGGFGTRECFAFLKVFFDVFLFGGGGVFDLFFFGNAEAVSLSNKRLMIMVETTAVKTEGNFLLERREEYRTVVRFGAQFPVPGTAAAAAAAASVDATFIVSALVSRCIGCYNRLVQELASS